MTSRDYELLKVFTKYYIVVQVFVMRGIKMFNFVLLDLPHSLAEMQKSTHKLMRRMKFKK